ncbi:DUF5994 family protein [Amycolatopsis mediterranei]|uniref:DUF5994 family protein n=1 Tax=Amycolatopsis mediterranei TaxID=33910 RepID=UPI003431B5E8
MWKPKGGPAGHVDGGWWPWTHHLPAELPALTEILTALLGYLTKVTYTASEWDSMPPRLEIGGHVVRFGTTGADPRASPPTRHRRRDIPARAARARWPRRARPAVSGSVVVQRATTLIGTHRSLSFRERAMTPTPNWYRKPFAGRRLDPLSAMVGVFWAVSESISCASGRTRVVLGPSPTGYQRSETGAPACCRARTPRRPFHRSSNHVCG